MDQSKKIGVEPAPKLLVNYDQDSDALFLWNGVPVEYSQPVVECLTAALTTVNSAKDGECEVSGFTLERAAELLLPVLCNEAASTRNLLIDYFEQTDTLSLWNGSPAGYGWDVAEFLLAELNGASIAEGGAVVGFTLEHAAELLLPFLRRDAEDD